MVRWAKGFQLQPNHRQLCHRKLYIYERVYCTFTREFTSGHGLMCTVMVMLGSRYSLQCFASCFDILAHLDSPKFYSRPAAFIRRPKFLFDLPSWWFAKVLRRQCFSIYGTWYRRRKTDKGIVLVETGKTLLSEATGSSTVIKGLPLTELTRLPAPLSKA